MAASPRITESFRMMKSGNVPNRSTKQSVWKVLKAENDRKHLLFPLSYKLSVSVTFQTCFKAIKHLVMFGNIHLMTPFSLMLTQPKNLDYT